MLAIPQKCAGRRRLPRRHCEAKGRSARRGSARPRSAAAARGPRRRSCGLFVRPKIRLSLRTRTERSGRLVFGDRDSHLPPAAGAQRRIARRTVANSRVPSVPAVVRVPATSIESLLTDGTPWNGPSFHRAPGAHRRAQHRAIRFRNTRPAALIDGFTSHPRKMRSTSSREEISRSRTIRAARPLKQRDSCSFRSLVCLPRRSPSACFVPLGHSIQRWSPAILSKPKRRARSLASSNSTRCHRCHCDHARGW